MNPVRREFAAHPSALAEIRSFIRDRSADAGFSPEATEEMVLAVSEASANSILHSGSSRISVGWLAEDDRTQVEVRDQGIFRRRVFMPELEGPGGHGIPLMMALMDDVFIQEGTRQRPGTVVRLVKYWARRRQNA